MATEFSISPANPIHFRTETGANAINSGSYYPGNYLYEDLEDFYNCEKLNPIQGHEQCFELTDETAIQVTYDTDTQAPIFPLTEIIWAELYNSAGTHISSLPYTRPYSSNQKIWNFAADWADEITVPESNDCFYIEIKTPETDSQVSVPWGDNGTFENAGTWNVGWTSGSTPNTTARSGAQAHGGSWSAQIDTANPPLLGDADFFISTSTITLVAGNTYTFGVFVYEPSIQPFTNAGDEVRWDLFDFTDATVLFEKRVEFLVDGQDAWHALVITFRCGSITNGDVKLVNVVKSTGARSTPIFPGTLYIDDFLFSLETERIQATSENFGVQTACPCTSLVEYYAGEGSIETEMGLTFHEASEALRFRYRVPVNFLKFRYDGDFRRDDQSDGTRRASYYRPKKIYEFETGIIAPHLVEIIVLSANIRVWNVDNIRYAPDSGSIEPEPVSDGTGYKLKMDMVLSGYTWQTNNCV
jgi:hypothetical protein